MTTIFCSNKLKDFIGATRMTAVDIIEKNDYGNWNGHLFYYGRQKYLIFVNNLTYYTIIIQDIKKADLKNFETIFFNRLTKQLAHDKVIDRTDTLIWLHKLLPMSFARTNNDKKAIGTLNDFVFQFKYSMDSGYWRDKDETAISSIFNNSLVGAGRTKDRQYGRPTGDMKIIFNSQKIE